jgi:hypothetical protein
MKNIIKLKEKDLHKIVKRVISEQNETSLQEKGMSKPTEGKIIRKRYSKRDGSSIDKFFIEYDHTYWDGRPGGQQNKTSEKKYLPLCEVGGNITINQEIMFDNIFMPFKPFANTTMSKSGDFHTGDPREKCVSVNDINYVSLSEYNPTTSNTEKTEDDWWNNEITD